jgi:hypothetical protein
MSPTLLSTLALLFLSYTHNVDASWSMHATTMITARVDPLVSPGRVAAVSLGLFFHYSRFYPTLASMFTT